MENKCSYIRLYTYMIFSYICLYMPIYDVQITIDKHFSLQLPLLNYVRRCDNVSIK